MGSACTKSEVHASTIYPRQALGHDYQEVEGQISGEGVKSTVAWKATLTEDELRSMREDFWRSRSSGRRQVWLALRQAAETDHESAAVLLQVAEIVTENGSMSVCLDNNGLRYELPPFVINDPISYFNAKGQKKTKKTTKESTISVKMRLMPDQHDILVSILNTSTVAQLKSEYRRQKPEISQMRLFFGGKELKDDQKLIDYGIGDEFVVQIFTRK